MRTVKASLIGGLVPALLVIVSLPTMAADTKGTLAIVNGVPGKSVDVCLNGKEIKSGLAYGGKIQLATVATGAKTIKFHARDPRKCKGTLLGRDQFPLPAAADLTIVVTKEAPRVVVFDNTGLGEIPPAGAPTSDNLFAIRMAADVGADLSFDAWAGPPTNIPVSPSAVFSKGQENRSPNTSFGISPGFVWQPRATIVGGAAPVRAAAARTVASHRYEWILVGTKASNARWVFIDRVVSHASP